MDLSTRQGRREQGQRLQEAVERSGMSIEDLATRIGCSRALIYQYVSGSTLAQPDRLQQISQICQVPLTYFYDDNPDARTESPPPSDMASRLAESIQNLQELADAQQNPPDQRALVATSERIVSLAQQSGDRTLQAQAQERLGQALLCIGEYPRAIDVLTRALALSQEIKDQAMEASTRQSLGNALLATGRTNEAKEQYAHNTEPTMPIHHRWRGLLALGAIDEQHGEYSKAMERFDEASLLLEESDESSEIGQKEAVLGLLYVNANRTNVYMDGGDFSGARALAEKCLSDAESNGNADQFLEARFNIAWCDLHTGKWSNAYRGLKTLIQFARFVEDKRRETMARAWLGILYAAMGMPDEALQEGKEALSAALGRGDRLSELYAQLALADAYASQSQRLGEARYHTEQAITVARALRLERAEAECRLRLCRLLFQLKEFEPAMESVDRALLLSNKLGARHLEAVALSWKSRLLTGDTAVTVAKRAVELAQATENLEGLFRGLTALGFATQLSDSIEMRNAFERAFELVEQLRTEMSKAGLDDTILEIEDYLEPVTLLTQSLIDNGQKEDAVALMDRISWLPFSQKFAMN